MPLYRVRCDQCGTEEDIYRSFADYNDLPDCCNGPMHRVICPSMVANDIEPYRSMATGQIIHSRSQHREHLRDHNLVEVGNETKYLNPKPITSPPGLKDVLVRVVNEKLR